MCVCVSVWCNTNICIETQFVCFDRVFFVCSWHSIWKWCFSHEVKSVSRFPTLTPKRFIKTLKLSHCICESVMMLMLVIIFFILFLSYFFMLLFIFFVFQFIGYFLTKIFHPNIASNGEICVNTLKRDWNPSLGLRHVLVVSF